MCISKPFFCVLGRPLRFACHFLTQNNLWVWCSSCWAKRRLSMAWLFNQLDPNRHNRFNRGITFYGGGRFMHRCQSTCVQVVRFRKDSIVFLSRFDCLMVVYTTNMSDIHGAGNVEMSKFMYVMLESVFLSF